MAARSPLQPLVGRWCLSLEEASLDSAIQVNEYGNSNDRSNRDVRQFEKPEENPNPFCPRPRVLDSLARCDCGTSKQEIDAEHERSDALAALRATATRSAVLSAIKTAMT